MKKVLSMLLTVVLVAQIKAQAKDSSLPKLIFTSYIGKANVTNSVNEKINNGSLAMTGLELPLNQHQSIFGEMNFDGYQYSIKEGKVTVKNTLNTVAVTLGTKYSFTTTKVQPYIKAGVGIASLSYPKIMLENGDVNIDNESKLCFQFQASVGVNYKLNKTYGLLADVGFQQYNTNKIFNNNISILNYKVGLFSNF